MSKPMPQRPGQTNRLDPKNSKARVQKGGNYSDPRIGSAEERMPSQHGGTLNRVPSGSSGNDGQPE